jgi:hypothetical protein
MKSRVIKPSSPPPANDTERERARILHKLVLLLSGLGAIAAVAVLASQGHGYLAAIGICLLLTLAAFVSGGALGFLFALPRVLSDSAPAPAPIPAPVPARAPAAGGAAAPAATATATAAATATARQAATARLLQSNTNLERISDWLTTMLVGVSLTQLNNVPRLMSEFQVFLAQSAPVFGGGEGETAGARWLPMVGCLLLVLAVLAGFMAMYLYMRLVLVRLFLQAERDLHEDGNRSEVLPVTAERELRDLTADAAFPDKSRQSRILSQPVLSIGDGLDLIYEQLYKEDFERAIQIAESLVNTGAADDPDYWFYRAAAYGQKHHSLVGDPKAATQREELRREVLRAAREAIKLDRDYRVALWGLTNKHAFDNDLQDFAEDPEFVELVRPRTVRRR